MKNKIKSNIIVAINSEAIVISENGKKLYIGKDNKLFRTLHKMNKGKIREWYLKNKDMV